MTNHPRREHRADQRGFAAGRLESTPRNVYNPDIVNALMPTAQRSAIIIRAGWIGTFGNAILSAMKIAVGLLSGSFSVVSDGIDSATDVITSLVTVFTVRISEKPPDREHPWGHARAETIATKLLSIIIFFAGAQLALAAGKKLFFHETATMPTTAALWVTGISIAAKLALALYKFRAGRATNCDMLIADAKNMRNDVVISASVLVGLFATFALHMPLIDPIVALIVSVWIMKVAFGIFFETSAEIMDGTPDQDVYRRIFKAVESVPGASHPHRTRVRRMGGQYVIDLDIEVRGDMTVLDAHGIARQVEEGIRGAVDRVYDVLVHVEPEGNTEEKECYGLSATSLDRASQASAETAEDKP